MNNFQIQKKITRSELRVLNLISYGLSSKEIADMLFLSEHTIHSHRANLLEKLKVKNSAGLVRVAIEQKLICLGTGVQNTRMEEQLFSSTPY